MLEPRVRRGGTMRPENCSKLCWKTCCPRSRDNTLWSSVTPLRPAAIACGAMPLAAASVLNSLEPGIETAGAAGRCLCRNNWSKQYNTCQDGSAEKTRKRRCSHFNRFAIGETGGHEECPGKTAGIPVLGTRPKQDFGGSISCQVLSRRDQLSRRPQGKRLAGKSTAERRSRGGGICGRALGSGSITLR